MASLDISIAIKRISEFDGRPSRLSLYLKATEKTYNAVSDVDKPELLNVILSRLTGRAAESLDSADDIVNFTQLKALLQKTFLEEYSFQCTFISLQQTIQGRNETLDSFAERFLLWYKRLVRAADNDDQTNKIGRVFFIQNIRDEQLQTIASACDIQNTFQLVKYVRQQEAILCKEPLRGKYIQNSYQFYNMDNHEQNKCRNREMMERLVGVQPENIKISKNQKGCSASYNYDRPVFKNEYKNDLKKKKHENIYINTRSKKNEEIVEIFEEIRNCNANSNNCEEKTEFRKRKQNDNELFNENMVNKKVMNKVKLHESNNELCIQRTKMGSVNDGIYSNENENKNADFGLHVKNVAIIGESKNTDLINVERNDENSNSIEKIIHKYEDKCMILKSKIDTEHVGNEGPTVSPIIENNIESLGKCEKRKRKQKINREFKLIKSVIDSPRIKFSKKKSLFALQKIENTKIETLKRKILHSGIKFEGNRPAAHFRIRRHEIQNTEFEENSIEENTYTNFKLFNNDTKLNQFSKNTFHNWKYRKKEKCLMFGRII